MAAQRRWCEGGRAWLPGRLDEPCGPGGGRGARSASRPARAQDRKSAPVKLALLVGCGILLPLGVAAWFLFRTQKYHGPNNVAQETLDIFCRRAPAAARVPTPAGALRRPMEPDCQRTPRAVRLVTCAAPGRPGVRCRARASAGRCARGGRRRRLPACAQVQVCGEGEPEPGARAGHAGVRV